MLLAYSIVYTIRKISENLPALKAEAWFIDDGTVAGSLEDLREVVRIMVRSVYRGVTIVFTLFPSIYDKIVNAQPFYLSKTFIGVKTRRSCINFSWKNCNFSAVSVQNSLQILLKIV